MSLYADYLKEREGKEVLENEDGFASFLVSGDECYVENVYVVPEKRFQHLASQMMDIIALIAKQRGCQWLTTSLAPSANGSQDSLLAILRYGMTLLRSDKDLVYFAKRIT